MRDFSRPALLVALVALFLVLTSTGPGFFFGISFSSTLRWVLFGLLIWFLCSSCGGSGCCGRRRRGCGCWGGCMCDCCDPDEDEGEDGQA
ncbi:MAG: hypothetical protein JJ896_08145 [Rhodothermales bacterium]|nr:hypothetical protein [Rhodothermales bacterium]MBO6779612.1 hypothetical protein [Rhodothermales bacterium]